MAGSILTAFASLYLGLGIAAVVGGVDLNRYKPTWWLAADATSTAACVREPAIAEIENRLMAGELSRSDGESIANSVLSLQQSSKPWATKCGDLLQLLQANKLISDEQWKRYARQATPQLTLRVRPRVRTGDPIAYSIDRSGARVGDRSDLCDRAGRVSISIGGVPIAEKEGRGAGVSFGGWMTVSAVLIPERYAGQIHPGMHRLELAYDRSISNDWSDASPVLHREKTRLGAEFELLAPDTRPVSAADDPALEDAVRKSITPQIQLDGQGRAQGGTMVKNPPVGLAYRISIITGGVTTRIGSLALVANGACSFGHGDGPILKKGDKVTVIYEPDLDTALRTTDVFEMYNRTIRFDEVPVKVR